MTSAPRLMFSLWHLQVRQVLQVLLVLFATPCIWHPSAWAQTPAPSSSTAPTTTAPPPSALPQTSTQERAPRARKTPPAVPAPSVPVTQSIGSLVHIEGVRDNQLVGYGLVVGLAGTGDGSQARYTSQSIKNMLDQFGVRMPDNVSLRAKNTAAVMVSASFPPGYRKGQAVDVTVASLGDAKSLRGGLLLLTPLRGVDGEVYALAQGQLVVPGVSAQGKSGSQVSINTTTSGRIPVGATIEREIGTDFGTAPTIRFNLKRPDFETASNMVQTINTRLGSELASALDATSVDVIAPQDPRQRAAFVAQIQGLRVSTGEHTPKVVLNSRTGTVVIGQGVTVRPAAVAHGSLRVTISETPMVSQPNALSRGETVVSSQSDVSVSQPAGNAFTWSAGTNLQDIVDAINQSGASPDDLMAILQALAQAGALSAELVII